MNQAVSICVFITLSIYIDSCKSELVLVHALFRHGDRTADKIAVYPNDPNKNETYFPFGYGQLVNEGKLREYNLGLELRTRYNEFLGDVYTLDILEAQSSDTTRTKMSLQLVLAGLFPAQGVEQWHPTITWQPIPYHYESVVFDEIFFGMVVCPKFLIYYEEYMQSEEMRTLLEPYQSDLTYISEKSGWSMNNLIRPLLLYGAVKAESDWGLEQPAWMESVYPYALEKLASIAIGSFSGTTELRQISGGHLIRKIVTDTISKINGSLSTQDRKLFLYSGHDLNVASLLNVLNVYDMHLPPYGSCVLIEIHFIDGEYGVKIFYENYKNDEPQLMKIPGCEEFCPFDKFVSLVEKYFYNVTDCW